MPAKNADLHGNVPDTADVALLLIDLINDLEFEGSEELLRYLPPVAERVAALKRRAKQAGVAVVYVNEDDTRGRALVELLKPDEDDYFVLKPKHSGFFATTLDTLLDYLKVKTLILAGVAGNICVLFTANDAFLRDFHLFVPSDCVASNDVEDNTYALRHMQKVLKADIRPSTELDFEELKRAARALSRLRSIISDSPHNQSCPSCVMNRDVPKAGAAMHADIPRLQRYVPC
jgi:nicotinamidase-related amidase